MGGNNKIMKMNDNKTVNKAKVSVKHLLVDKNNTVILYSAAITVAIVVFCIFAMTAFVKQISYQGKVISLRNTANKQLLSNLEATDSIAKAYEQFDKALESIVGTADKNPKIILDALPSKYDFPALTASIESLARESGLALKSINGIDDEALAEQDSINPKPILIPFEIQVSGSLASIQLLVDKLEASIRPIKIVSMSLTVVDTSMEANISAVTYYQPEKLLDVAQYIVNKNGQVQEGN